MATRRANRGHGDPLPAPAGPVTPVLGVDDEGHLVWSPALTPDGVVSAIIQSADTVDGPWTDHAVINWTDQPWTIDVSHQAWRLVGVDGDSNPVTNPSNVVDLL